MPNAIPSLTTDQFKQFFEVGFLQIPALFRADEIAAMRVCCDRLQKMADELGENGAEGFVLHKGSQFVLGRVEDGELKGKVRIDRVVWVGAAEPHLLAVGEDPRLLSLAAQVLNADTCEQLINQVHFKLPGDGVVFDWHQDSRHRRFGSHEWRDLNGRGSFVEIALALDDVGPDNGPMQFVKNSPRHAHILTSGQHHVLPDFYIEKSEIVTPTMQAGDVLLFGPLAIHGSLANHSSRSRRMLLNGYAYPGANSRVYPGDGAGRRLHCAR